MSERLNPNGNPVRLGDVVLRTPGLEGQASLKGRGAEGMRAAALTTPELEKAFTNEDLQIMRTVEIEKTNEVDIAVPGMRSTAFGEPAIELEVPAPTEGWEQMVLATDESGVVNWSFAQDERGEADRTRATGATRTYVLRRRVTRSEDPSGTRGLVGILGKKVLKVLAFPLIEKVGGKVVEWGVRRWETKKRPHRLRTFTPDDYKIAEGGKELTAWPWPAYERALLMVHGTNSRTHIAFGGMPVEFVKELNESYQGRVAALDHPTLSEAPGDNVSFLANLLPKELEIDIICHSRGGLVSRLLSEQQSRFGLDSLAVRRLVFVATPNNGTALTDPKHMGSYVDCYTNLLNFFPDNGVTETLEGIINVAKSIAVGGLEHLRGVQSMNPRGHFLKELNQGTIGETSYFALGADFEPPQPGLKEYAKDILMDSIFRVDNDLVVPTDSVYASNPSGYFPVENRHVYPPEAGIHHSGFFGNPDAHARIRGWLSS